MNYFGYLDGVYGVKTGFTNNAGRCLVTSIKRGDFDIICIVLGADTKKFRTQDSIKLIEYTYQNFEIVNINEIIQSEYNQWKSMKERTINIYKGVEREIETYLQDTEIESMAFNKNEIKDIKVVTECIDETIAPVQKDTIIGIIKLMKKDEVILELNILNKKEILKKGIKEYFIELIANSNNS